MTYGDKLQLQSDGARERRARRERQRQRRSARLDGWIYFIQVGTDGPIKIGYAGDVKRRLGELQLANPFELRLVRAVRGNVLLERQIHAIYAHARLRGEWFTPVPELVAFVASAEERP